MDSTRVTSMKNYRVFVLTPQGSVIDSYEITCSDVEDAKERAKVIAEHNPVEIWEGAVRIARLGTDSLRCTTLLMIGSAFYILFIAM